MKYEATYWDGERTWNGYSDHPQVDTGYGFTCDENIVEMVRALNSLGDKIRTAGSCQNTSDSGIKNRWIIPRAWVNVTSDDPHLLLDLALYLRKALFKEFGCDIDLGVNTNGLVYLSITYTESVSDALLNLINSVPVDLRERIRSVH